MPDDKYCLCCGEYVPVNTITRDGNLELTCIYCGFVLDVARPGVRQMLQYVVTADDCGLTRDLLKSMLLTRRLAREITAVQNGREFVAVVAKRLTDRLPLSLVILDMQMPVMDGVTAARVMRTVEGTLGGAKTPILFFSAQKSDESLKRQLEVFAPASYVNKGSDADPLQLIERIDQLIAHLQR